MIIKQYLNRKIPSYIAITIIIIAAIMVARFAYWGYMEVIGEIYQVVEVRISEKGERVTFYSGCLENDDFWMKASEEDKVKKCNEIFSDQFELRYDGSEARSCSLMISRGEPCSPGVSGSRLVCVHECKEEEENITD